MTLRTYTHAIIYIGAPYGVNEDGHIVSRHTSRSLADRAFDRAYAGTTGERSNMIVDLSPGRPFSRHHENGQDGSGISATRASSAAM